MLNRQKNRPEIRHLFWIIEKTTSKEAKKAFTRSEEKSQLKLRRLEFKISKVWKNLFGISHAKGRSSFLDRMEDEDEDNSVCFLYSSPSGGQYWKKT